MSNIQLNREWVLNIVKPRIDDITDLNEMFRFSTKQAQFGKISSTEFECFFNVLQIFHDTCYENLKEIFEPFFKYLMDNKYLGGEEPSDVDKMLFLAIDAAIRKSSFSLGYFEVHLMIWYDNIKAMFQNNV